MRDEFEHIIDQFRQRDNLAVAQLGKLPSGSYIGLARLVQLDRIRLAPDLLSVPFSSPVVVNPPDTASDGILVDSAHRSPHCFGLLHFFDDIPRIFG
jgi:hypothetical protein